MTSTRDKPERPATPSDAARGGEEAFLRRWSKRKHEARAQQAAAPPAEAPPAEPPKAPEKLLTDADMPPVESLDENSDFSLFMSAGVSDELRRRALRKLFALPGINQRCPLDGEWYDCHGYEPLGNIVTYEMREEMEREARKLKESVMEALGEGKQAPADASAPLAARAEDDFPGRDAAGKTPANDSAAADPTPQRPSRKENNV